MISSPEAVQTVIDVSLSTGIIVVVAAFDETIKCGQIFFVTWDMYAQGAREPLPLAELHFAAIQM